MAGLNTSQTESDYGFSLPHLMGLAGLLTGIGLFLVLSSRGQPDLPGSPNPDSIATDSPGLQTPPLQKSELLDAPTGPIEAVNARSQALPAPAIPAIAERRPKAFTSKKFLTQPVVAAVAEKPAVFESPSPRRQQLTEAELEWYLSESVPTVGLDLKQAGDVLNEVSISKTFNPLINPLNGPEEVVLALLDETTINGLPFAESQNCEIEQSKARSLEKYSRLLHTEITNTDRSTRRGSSLSASSGTSFSHSHRGTALVRAINQKSEFQGRDAIPALVQILQVESQPVRAQLVDKLAASRSPEATQALVKRAVFDLSPQVRRYANMALGERPHKEYRLELLEAFRYPWSPVAWHAAETLVAVKDEKAVPYLIELLDAPDPAKPHRDHSGKLVVRELVRINHLQNCLLCHAPSREKNDLVAGVVPTPGRPIRPIYYGSHRSSSDVQVRADVTYLRQDFSVMHSVNDSKRWPDHQRFDYLVRTRAATSGEIAVADSMSAEETHQYPQREAVLFALRKLTGRNVGTQSKNWRRLKL